MPNAEIRVTKKKKKYHAFFFINFFLDTVMEFMKSYKEKRKKNTFMFKNHPGSQKIYNIMHFNDSRR